MPSPLLYLVALSIDYFAWQKSVRDRDFAVVVVAGVGQANMNTRHLRSLSFIIQ